MNLVKFDPRTLAEEYQRVQKAVSAKAKGISKALKDVGSFNMGHVGSADAPPTSDELRGKLNSIQHHVSLLAGINVDVAKLKHISKAALSKLGAALKHLADKETLALREEIEAGRKMTVSVVEATVRINLSEPILAAAELEASVEKIAGLYEAVRFVHSHLSQSSDTVSQMIRLLTWENAPTREIMT